MTGASTNSYSALRDAALRALALLIGAALAMPAAAHKASDAYLLLEAPAPDSLQASGLRVDIALRDLDAALDIDADGDARLTWAEVRAAFPAIEAYVLQRVEVAGCAAQPRARALEQRADGAYAALTLALQCHLPAEPLVRYSVLREIDPTHRGLLRIQRPGEPPVLRVLVPTADVTAPAIAPATGTTGAPRVGTAGVPIADTASAKTPTRAAGEPSTAGFLAEGIRHIVSGYDHVLFLLCLLLPAVMRRTREGWQPVTQLGQAVWPVAGIVTAFTVAHSLTLTLAALKLVALPAGFIEPAIAATIALAALDNLRPIFRGHRGIVTFGFGLIHGFGFAGVLAELDLPGTAFAWALLQFNVGLELGQLAIVALATGLLFGVRRHQSYPGLAIRGGSLAAIVIGVLWFIERIADVSLLPM
ncbi:MAG: HupE/UreJ family protein [Burkholderiaceae bacterium]